LRRVKRESRETARATKSRGKREGTTVKNFYKTRKGVGQNTREHEEWNEMSSGWRRNSASSDMSSNTGVLKTAVGVAVHQEEDETRK